MLTPTPLTDEEVLETFQNMNDVIRMRMITTEVLPSPMQKYRIGKETPCQLVAYIGYLMV
jgi:hypothetical protein